MWTETGQWAHMRNALNIFQRNIHESLLDVSKAQEMGFDVPHSKNGSTQMKKELKQGTSICFIYIYNDFVA